MILREDDGNTFSILQVRNDMCYIKLPHSTYHHIDFYHMRPIGVVIVLAKSMHEKIALAS